MLTGCSILTCQTQTYVSHQIPFVLFTKSCSIPCMHAIHHRLSNEAFCLVHSTFHLVVHYFTSRQTAEDQAISCEICLKLKPIRSRTPSAVFDTSVASLRMLPVWTNWFLVIMSVQLIYPLQLRLCGERLSNSWGLSPITPPLQKWMPNTAPEKNQRKQVHRWICDKFNSLTNLTHKKYVDFHCMN